MVGVDLNTISELLDQALDVDPAARELWLADLARTAPDVAGELRKLLSRQSELETGQLLMAGGRLLSAEVLAMAIEGSTYHRTASDNFAQFTLQPGTDIGPYRLIRPIGEGGMASVWLAERTDGQLKRDVALKLLHAWRNSAELVERFARERDMLAGLVHPNIARLYDAGVTAAGQPWIALEYVEGVDFATFADNHFLSIRQRVHSILQVMGAVQYAHQNLIVHRDLKPTNILVNPQGEVRLLDFGIAKLLLDENQSAEETALTRESARMLTLRYAAPEQIEGKAVTTATDVYALGLVLYELLTGSSARDAKSRQKKSNRSPSPTSTKSSADVKHGIAATANNPFTTTADILRPSRGIFGHKAAHARGNLSAAEMKSTLSGDLDTIVLKALALEPARRYPTVSAFAADLNAWLERKPITARPPSMTYAAKMFISRQRIPVGIATFAMLALIAAGGYSWKQRAAAELHRARAEEVQTFMANLLTEAEPEGIEGEKALTAESLLDAGVERARFDYANKPLMRGEMIAELARVYLRIGEKDTGGRLLNEAITLIEQNASSSEPSLHVARSYLGGQLLRSSKDNAERERAIAMLNAVVQGCGSETTACKSAKGTAHLSLANDPGLSNAEKLAHTRSALALFGDSFGAGSEDRVQALLFGADLERGRGNFVAASTLMNQAESYFSQRRGKSTERNLFFMTKANLAFDQGSFTEAANMVDRMLTDLTATKQTATLLYLHVVRAHIANYQGLSDVALEHTLAARNLSAKIGQPILLIYALRYEARALSMSAKHAQAFKTVEEAFEKLREVGVEKQSEIWLDIVRARAETLARSGDLTRAKIELTGMLSVLRVAHPDNFRDLVSSLDLLGAVSFALGDATLALQYHTDEIRLLDARLPADHPLRLRAELQVLRVKNLINPTEGNQIRLVELVQQVKKYLPEGSVHSQALSKLVDSESRLGIQQQLVYIF